MKKKTWDCGYGHFVPTPDGTVPKHCPVCRDEFARAVLPGAKFIDGSIEDASRFMARACYIIADAMMAERSREK